MDLNKVMLIGNIVNEPEMRMTGNGQNVATFNLATNLTWIDSKGEKQNRAEFHKIIAWKGLAEVAHRFITTGVKIYVEGRLQTRSYEKDGQKKYYTEIVAENIILLSRKDKAESEIVADTEQEAEIDEVDAENIPF